MMHEAFYPLNSNPFRMKPDSRFCPGHSGSKSAREYFNDAHRLEDGCIMVAGWPDAEQGVHGSVRGIDLYGSFL
jgi:hypothetical protein